MPGRNCAVPAQARRYDAEVKIALEMLRGLLTDGLMNANGAMHCGRIINRCAIYANELARPPAQTT